MNAADEIKILVSGIESIKSELRLPMSSGASTLELLDRLETLRWCLEALLKKEVDCA